jgi:hypothetical protein
MSIGCYLIVAVGLLLFISGGGLVGEGVVLSVRFIRVSASGFKSPGSIWGKLLEAAIGLALLLAGYTLLSEGFPFSVRMIAWVVRILGWLLLVLAVGMCLQGISNLRLRRAPARDYRELILIPLYIIAVIAISTYACGATRSDRYYRDIIPSLAGVASYADSQTVRDPMALIKPGLAVFITNHEPIEVGWMEKAKQPNTIDDDVTFRLPRRILTRSRRDLNTAALLDWTYIPRGSRWYQRTRNGLAIGEPFEVKRVQTSCRVTLVDVASRRVIDRREFRGSVPGWGDTGSDPAADIVRYLKEAVERAAQGSNRPA